MLKHTGVAALARRRHAHRSLIGLLLFAAGLSVAGSPNEFRAFWVDAWGAGFMNQSQVDTLLGVPGNASSKGTIRDANCNAVIVQVRRRYDVCYPSGVGEPYMSGLSPANFNALEAMINAAHDTTGGKKRIEVHCWLVTFATAGGTVYSQHIGTPTGDPVNLDNYWPTRDDTGAETDDKAFDPGHPLVLQYIVNVCMDMVNNFDIDGIHYDYIRFTANNQGYNPTSIARYNARYGLTGQPAAPDEQFKQWRRDQVTAVVRQVYARIQKSKPWVKQSGSFVTWNPSPTNSTRAAFQGTRPYYDVYSDWDSWVQEGIVDMAVPMTYYDWASLPSDYTKWMSFEKDRKFNRHMIVGPGIYLNYLSDAILELQMTRNASPAGKYADGFCGYSYRSPYSTAKNPRTYGTWAGFSPSLVSQVTTNWADIPDMPWKTAPTNGHLMGTVTIAGSGAWADHALVRLNSPANRTNYVDGTGFYAFIELPPGSYTVTASFTNSITNYAPKSVAVAIAAGMVTTADVILGSATQPPSGLITNVAAFPRHASALITWDTISNATAQVAYGLTTDLGLVSLVNATLRTNHEVMLTGLLPRTNYSFRALAQVGTNLHQSALFSFATTPTLIVDNPQAGYAGDWVLGVSPADQYGSYFQYATSIVGPGGSAWATYTPDLPVAGQWDVAVWYPAGYNRTTNAPVWIIGDDGFTAASVDQTTGGGRWQLIAANRAFSPGAGGCVMIANDSGEPGKLVVADAARFSYSAAQDIPTDGTVPAWWSDYYFGDAVNAAFDPDGDGYSTFAEYVIGTDPTDVTSKLRVRMERLAGGLQVVFSPWQHGRAYRLECATSLVSGFWQPLTNTASQVGSEGVIVVSSPPPGRASFYRLAPQLVP